MKRRLPSAPPNLPGFSFIRVLGSGGFADVFLYEQNLPRRLVAIKVMLAEVVNSQMRQMFQAEANVMAQLSTHPSILTVYEAGVASDGRPYLVMEFCSSSVGDGYRKQSLSISDVLRIGIKIASAVETAHNHGVLHRDIKPSNILMTAYGHPVLSDFGIASTLDQSDVSEAVGLSIPWSAPEVLADESTGTVTSEIYSLAATIYSLLAGRSPFEEPDADNSSSALMARIARSRSQPIGRPDVPVELEQVLARAMNRKATARYGSVLEFIRELQRVETELGYPQTPIEVASDDWASHTGSDPEDRTRIRPVAATASPPRRRRKPVVHGHAAAEDGASGSQSGEFENGPRSAASRPNLPTRRMRAVTWALIALGALVLVLGISAGVILLRAGSSEIPQVGSIAAGVQQGTVRFSWADPGLTESDSYQITTHDGLVSTQRATDFQVDVAAAERVCITVTVIREGKMGAPSGQKCSDVPGSVG